MAGGLIERLPMWFLASALLLGMVILGYALFVSDRCLYILGLQTGPCQTQTADALPSGAVVAFDRAGCPADWTPMREAQSRVIVGAIGEDGFLGAYDTDEAGRPLTERRYREKGGMEGFRLSEEHIPHHQHVFSASFSTPLLTSLSSARARAPDTLSSESQIDARPEGFSYATGDNVSGTSIRALTLKFSDEERPVQIDAEPAVLEAIPHPNMPPYIALYFCKKD